MKILVVDDSKVMRSIVLRNLKGAGWAEHEYVEAVNGAEALATIEAGGIDLVLSDWNMPEMNGYQCLTTLRERGNQTRFGFVTSEGSEEMRAKAKEAGALFLLAKPFSPEMFKEALGAVLG